MIKNDIFENKLQGLHSLSSTAVDTKHIETFREYVLNFAANRSTGLNPYIFSEETGIPFRDVLSLFLFSVKADILNIAWNQVCPDCGGIHSNHDTINSIDRDSYFCFLCDSYANTALDEWIEVSFSLNRDMLTPVEKKISSNIWEYTEKYFSSCTIMSQKQLNTLENLTHGFTFIEPGETASMSFLPEADQRYMLFSFEINNYVYFDTTIKAQNSTPRIFDIEINSTQFNCSSPAMHAADTTFRLTNRSGQKVLVILSNYLHGRTELEPRFRPFLNGKTLLNSQLFRTLFRYDRISQNLSLTLRSLSILFSDIKDSTILFEKLGDVKAYELVNRHFEILMQCIDSRNGAVVKTIGDAVMATFNNPIDSLEASIDIIRAINKWQETIGDFGIKIGLNEGQSLAVNLNDTIDYFGQSVNIAARVQGLANANELWVTEPVLNNSKVNKKLIQMENNKEVQIKKHIAQLKGIIESQTVYQLNFIDVPE